MSISTKTTQKKVPSDKSVFRKQVNNKNSLNKQNSPAQEILNLHQTIGNQAVQRLFESGFIQGKLTVGEPNDKYEQEADRVADQVQRQSEEDEEEEMLQTKPIDEQITPLVQRQVEEEEGELLQFQSDVSEAENRTGMPSPLRAGLEQLSGMDLSGVRVHNNTSKPAQLNALAYTQGQDIYVGPGQKKHLPHEGWHAVQQMQGRVKPTMQAKGVSINDDAGLEREADVMGTKALEMKRSEQATMGSVPQAPAPHSGITIQRAMKFEIQTVNHVWMMNKGGVVNPVPRKYGLKGATEKGEEQFLTTGISGKPHVRKGEFVEAEGIDLSKPAQYMWTYTVINKETGKISQPEKKKNQGSANKINLGTYELKYVDTKGNSLKIHRNGFGHFQLGLGPLMRKASRTEEGSAVELQAESGGFIEFETPKWHRKWSAIKARIEEAQKMTKDMEETSVITENGTKDAVSKKIDKLKKAGKRSKEMGTLRKWPTHFRAEHLPVIRKGGNLLVEIVPGGASWTARIQVSESLALQEFESLLKEHETAVNVVNTLRLAQTIFDSLKPTHPTKAALFKIINANLKGLLQMIVYYIVRGQGFEGNPKPSKSAFRLMSRTSFYSIYKSLLTKEEQTLFKKLVKSGIIPSTLGLTNSDPVLKQGHGRVRARNKANPKIGKWLVSIYSGGGSHPDKGSKKTDLMSRPEHGSAAMGRFDVDTREGKKHSGLVRIEVRLSKKHMGGNDQPRDKWLSYVRKVFKQALKERSTRSGILPIDAIGKNGDRQLFE